VVGVAMMILGWGLVDGLDENFLRASSQVLTGDVLLRPEDYPIDGSGWPIDKAVPPPDLSPLKDYGPTSARTLFQGRLINGPDAARVVGVAYDPKTDPEVFPREKWKMQGRWPQEGANEVVIGDRLADLIGAKLDSDLVFEARTWPGAMNALTYHVVGLVHTDSAQLDANGCWIPMPLAEELLQLEGRRTHIALKLEHGSPEAAAEAWKGAGWKARTVRQECADLLEINDFRRRAISFMVLVIMLIAATGILNSVLMAAFERIKEIGTLRALGMTTRNVATMFLVEGVAMGLVAGIAGAILGSAAVLYWQKDGILLGEDVMKMSADMAVSAYIYTKFSWPPVIGSVFFALVVAWLATLYPTWVATRMSPADAVRSE